MMASAPKIDDSMNTRKKAFVLGDPIEHSLSPSLHQVAYEHLGYEIDYGRWKTSIEELPERFLPALTENVVGYSVTMPLKNAVIENLHELTDFAKVLDVVNTVYWRGEGSSRRAIGHNTDVSGIVNALHHAGVRVSTDDSPRAILGGGGTATSALMALSFLGSTEVDLYVRSVERAATVLRLAEKLEIRLNICRFEDFASQYSVYEAVISTLPAGVADQFAPTLGSSLNGVLFDVSYDPWPSTIASRWEDAGGVIVSGLDMLLYQAIDQIKLFTGHALEETLPEQLQMMNAMCSAIGLLPRNKLPLNVYSMEHFGSCG
ncbi:shikimate dehydrogenase family protein [Rothia sp. CCM 9419]|uniref:shikimate dehydrogenase family protein n=1 Tax=Rothia sp. CCM 9419 TaxID=3402662 RepID=UPI003AED3416